MNKNENLKEDLSIEEWKIILQDKEIIESSKIKNSNIDFLKICETIYSSYENIERSHKISVKCDPVKYNENKPNGKYSGPTDQCFNKIKKAIIKKYGKLKYKFFKLNFVAGCAFATIPKQGNGRYYWKLNPNLETALKELKIISDEKYNENKLNGSHDKDIKDRGHLIENTVKIYTDESKIITNKENLKNNSNNSSPVDEESNLNLNLYSPDREESYIGIEGEKKYVTLLKRERDTKLRNECIKIKGLNCEICNFNFEIVYGELGKKFYTCSSYKPNIRIRRFYRKFYKRPYSYLS